MFNTRTHDEEGKDVKWEKQEGSEKAKMRYDNSGEKKEK